jgi:hypothetical protein
MLAAFRALPATISPSQIIQFKRLKRIVLSFVLTVLSASATAKEPYPELVGESVALAASHLDANLDWKKYSTEYLRAYKAQRFASVMHDPAQVETARKAAEAELRQMAKDRVHRFARLRRTVGISSITPNPADKRKFTVVLDPVFGSGSTFVDSSLARHGFAKPAYNLMFANQTLTRSFDVPKDLGERLRLALQEKRIWSFVLDMDVELISIHQGENVNTVLRELRWHRDDANGELIAVVTETKPSAELVAKRMLAEGTTLGIPLDHSGLYGTHRLNEYLIEEVAGDCTELPRERGHRVFSCVSYGGNDHMNGKARTKFVGGRGVVVELFVDRQAAPKDQAELVTYLSNTYKMSPETVRTWKWWQARAEVIISYRDALNADGNKPYLVATSRDYKKMLAGAKEFGVVK